MINFFTLGQLRKKLRFFFQSVRRHQHGDRMADSLLRSIAKQPLGADAPTRDDAV